MSVHTYVCQNLGHFMINSIHHRTPGHPATPRSPEPSVCTASVVRNGGYVHPNTAMAQARGLACSLNETSSRFEKRSKSLVKLSQVVFIVEKVGRDTEVSFAGCYGDATAA